MPKPTAARKTGRNKWTVYAGPSIYDPLLLGTVSANNAKKAVREAAKRWPHWRGLIEVDAILAGKGRK